MAREEDGMKGLQGFPAARQERCCPPRRRRAAAAGFALWPLIAGLLLVFIVALVAALWLVATPSGLKATTQALNALAQGELVLEGAQGRIAGPLSLARVQFKGADWTLAAERVAIDWQPARLARGEVRILSLSVGKLEFTPLAAAQTASAPPDELILPWRFAADDIAIGEFSYAQNFVVREILARFTSDGRHHELELVGAQSGAASARGRAKVDGAAPISLTADAELVGTLADAPFTLTLSGAGALARWPLKVAATQGIRGDGEAIVTPFAAAPFASARLALTAVDPAAWHEGAPRASLAIVARIEPRAGGDGVLGEVTIANSTAGPLDAGRLPLVAASARFDWQPQGARLDAIAVQLLRGGRLSGSGQWREETLLLELAAAHLDASALHSALRATRLAGPIVASVGSREQSARVRLSDPRFSIVAEARRSGTTLAVERVEIASGASRLRGKASVDLAAAMRFAASGELVEFDPARFAKIPAAQLNATFSAAGFLQPRPRASVQFALGKSRFAGHPLAGRGEIRIDWPALPAVDVVLDAGENHLRAHGAFGRKDDTLVVDIDARKLADYGLEGDLKARIELTGGVDAPRFSARLAAQRLAIPGSVRVAGFAVQASGGASADSPFALELTAARVDTADRPGLARALRVEGEGRTRAQSWRAGAELAGGRQIVLAAQGGFAGDLAGGAPLLWRGELGELRLSALGAEPRAAAGTPAAAAKSITALVAPAPLVLGSERWSIGPARLAGSAPAWQATLFAQADARAAQLSVDAGGERLGRIDLAATATMRGAWALDRQAPWRARLASEIGNVADLVALAAASGFIDASWQAGGRLAGALTLSGTPARPLFNGRWQGTDLVLRRAAQGLELTRGELEIELANNLLRVRKLSFESVLQAMPAPLRRVSSEAVRALTAKPGRLEVTGELALSPEGAGNAFLDFRVDRLGLWQLPDEWLLVSGEGRIAWRAGTLSARAALAADAGYWQLAAGGAPQLSDDVVIRRAGSKGAAPTGRSRLNLDVDIRTALGDSLLFRGAGLTSRLEGEVRWRAAGRDLPRASGTIVSRGGRFEAYGQDLEIERGILTFQGLVDNPALDIRAVRKGLAVEAGVEVGGSARKPVVRLVSDPELPDAEKLAWLVLGHGSSQMGAGDAATLVAAASGILGSGPGAAGGSTDLVGQLKRRFGVDELALRQGEIGDTGRQATSRVATSGVDTPAATGSQIFVAGRRLSARTVLSYEQAIGKAESIVKLTVALTRQLSLVGRAGSDNALDLVYTITLGGKKTQEDAKSEKK